LQQSQTPPAQVNIDSTNFYPFTTPTIPQFTAEILPIGAGPTPLSRTAAQVLNNECQDLLEDAVFNNSITEIPYEEEQL
jgi:hypothetical protein